MDERENYVSHSWSLRLYSLNIDSLSKDHEMTSDVFRKSYHGNTQIGLLMINQFTNVMIISFNNFYPLSKIFKSNVLLI